MLGAPDGEDPEVVLRPEQPDRVAVLHVGERAADIHDDRRQAAREARLPHRLERGADRVADRSRNRVRREIGTSQSTTATVCPAATRDAGS